MARRRRRPATRLADWLRALLAFLFSNVGVIVLVVGYTIAGAFMFQAIEGASEMERVSNMGRERDSTAQYLWHNVTLMYNPLNETAIKDRISKELQVYQSKVVFAVRRGWDGGRSSRQWSFSSAFLYSLTVITTIGYGHLSPRTPWGKITTIFYALLGMPLFLLYLTNVGELLARWCKCLYALICMCRGCPGFSKRRIVRMRNQLEVSDIESIERPEHWRDYPNMNAGDHWYSDSRHPEHRDFYFRNSYGNYRDPDYINPEYWKPDFRIPNYRNPDHRKTNTRNIDNWSHVFNRNPDERYPQTRFYGTYPGRYPSLPPYRMSDRRPLERIPERIPMQRIPFERYQESRRPPELNGLPLRRPDYLRSASMPQAYIPPQRIPQRGWSEPARAVDQDSSEFSYVTFDAQTITVPISVCVCIMVGYLLFGSMLFGMWEKWDQLDGAYFCFISLSSIGFGDFVPGERVYTPRIETSFIVCSMYLMLGMALVAMCFNLMQKVLYQYGTFFIVCSMYLMLGMALVAMCLNLMQEQVIHYVAGLKRAVKRICRCRRCKR